MVYRYGLLRPGQGADAEAHNRPLLGPATLGIEVTEPALAARCGLGNLDPQHGARHGIGTAAASPAAISAALICPLPPDGAILVTVRPDLDALGAMAVLALRAEGVRLGPETAERMTAAVRADRFDYGPWPGPSPLPRTVQTMAEKLDGGVVAGLAAAMRDDALTMAARVDIAREWLASGAVPPRYLSAGQAQAAAMLAALEAGEITLDEAAGGRVAVVVGRVLGANRLGYVRAPVVVALNPAHRFADGDVGPKFTLSQYDPGHADLDAAVAEIAAAEPGWGGQANIKGSPQDRPSRLALDAVVAAVTRHLRPATQPQ